MTPAYNRELIADMLDGYGEHTNCDMGLTHFGSAIAEQIRLLREADNAEAAKVGTVAASEEGLPERLIALAEVHERDSREADTEFWRNALASEAATLREAANLIRRLAASGQGVDAKDAARYRWMKQWDVGIDHEGGSVWRWRAYAEGSVLEPGLDAVVDAAMKEQA